MDEDDDKPTGPDVEHLEWAIDQRGKIQQTILKLYTFLRSYDPHPARAAWQDTSALDDLIAASFSLWRAAFLASSTRDFMDIQRAQVAFLEKLITTNAIAFSDDVKSDAWTFGYYLQDAMYRLLSARRVFEPMLAQEDQSKLRGLLQVHATSSTAALNRHQWERVHAALRIFLAAMTKDKSLPPEIPGPYLPHTVYRQD